jgi:pimeloyl-ACP methyl ester carboxylesterase
MTTITKTITLKKNFNISYMERPSDGESPIVFIHGLGSAKEHFRYALNSPSLETFQLLAVDLVGFGQSQGPDEFEYTMKDQARIIIELLDHLDIDDFHLCGHSLGGIIAIEIAELAPQRVLSLIDLEGNLTLEDCFITGVVAGSTFVDFAEKERANLEKEFSDAGINDPAMSEYAETFAKASTVALYKSACYTIEESSKPLMERLIKIKNMCYIYGERNRGVFPTSESLLQAAGVQIFYIEDAGHSMAVENPKQLYSVIRSFIDGLSPTSPR